MELRLAPLLWFTLLILLPCSTQQKCSSCFSRWKHKVLLLLAHKGHHSSLMLEAGARQAALELDIQLEVFASPQDKTAFIEKLASSSFDSLVVEIVDDSSNVLEAVQSAAENHRVVAVVGGAELRTQTGIRNHFGVVHQEVGGDAANRLNVTNLLCLTSDNSYVQRTVCDGAKIAQEARHGTLMRLAVDGTNNFAAEEEIKSALQAKTVEGFLLTSATQLPAVTSFLGQYKAASVEANAEMVELIMRGSVSFALDPALYNQGYFAVHTVVMAAHTGNLVQLPLLRTGPVLLNANTVPQLKRYVCALKEQDFVYCPRVPKTAGCECINRTATVRVAMNQHESPKVSAFWGVVQAGIDAYANNFAVDNGGVLGIDIRYPNLFAPKEQAALLLSQLALHPEAVALTIPAEQVEQALLQGISRGTPIYTYNAGLDLAAKIGTRSHLGQDESDAGRRAGEYWAAEAVKRAFCLNHRRGLQVLVDRCTGLEAGLNASGGSSAMLYITGESSVDVLRQQLADAMTPAPHGAAFLALNSNVAALAVDVAQSLQRPDLRIGTFDFDSPLVPMLQNGTMEFSLHQQNYAQGFFTILFMAQGVVSGAWIRDLFIASGPAIVTKTEVDAYLCEAEGFPLCVKPQEQPEATSYLAAVVPSIAAGLLLLGIGVVVLVVWLRRRNDPKRQNLNRAPRTTPLGVMFTDIQSSTRMWAEYGTEMGQAINIHHDVIREVLVDHGAYEVKTIGDAFMIGCSSATQMVDVATDIQLRLNASQWPLQITLDARDNGQDPALWNGLRVRIGMHWGDPTVYVDPVVGSVDYYGSTVNCASRVEAVGAGGQIVCTAQTFDQVQKETKDKIEHYLAQKKYSFQPLKQVRLRGISGLVDLYQVTPLELSGRQFPELVSPLPMAEEEVPQKESWFLINMEPQMKKHACVASGQYTLERFTEFCDDLMEFLKTIMAKTSDPSGWKRLLRKDWGAAPQSAQDEFGMAKVVLRATRWQATGEGDDWNDRKSDGRSVAPTHRCSIGLVADVHLNAVTRV